MVPAAQTLHWMEQQTVSMAIKSLWRKDTGLGHYLTEALLENEHLLGDQERFRP